jgi:hypothetical protein
MQNDTSMKITVTLNPEQEKYFKDVKYSLEGESVPSTNSDVINHCLLELLLFEKLNGDCLTTYLTDGWNDEYQKAIRELEIGDNLKPSQSNQPLEG